MNNKIPAYLLHAENITNNKVKSKTKQLSFLDATLLNSANTVKSMYVQAENSTQKSFVHQINPHIKLISLIYMAIVISIVANLYSQLFISVFIFCLYFLSKLPIFKVYRKIILLAFLYGFIAVVPASLNIISSGEIIFNLFSFDKPFHFWVYQIPQQIGITLEGLQVIALVFLRVFNSISISMLIIFTTSFPAFIKSFKIIGIPDTFLMITTLAYKYIFILSKTIQETYLALKSRLSGNIDNNNLQKLVSGRVFYIFKRSLIIYKNTYFAMVSRGYEGKVVLQSQKPMNFKDVLTLIFVVAFGLIFILI